MICSYFKTAYFPHDDADHGDGEQHGSDTSKDRRSNDLVQETDADDQLQRTSPQRMDKDGTCRETLRVDRHQVHDFRWCLFPFCLSRDPQRLKKAGKWSVTISQTELKVTVLYVLYHFQPIGPPKQKSSKWESLNYCNLISILRSNQIMKNWSNFEVLGYSEHLFSWIVVTN